MKNVGEKYGLSILTGVRHPHTTPISANGCFIIAIKHDEPNDEAIVCAVFDGYPFTYLCPRQKAFNIAHELIHERNWKNMEDHDLYVSCHGMGDPKQPFWQSYLY